MILVRRFRQGQRVYDEIPHKIAESDKNPNCDVIGKHINKIINSERILIIKYINEKGYTLRESDIEQGISNNDCLRNELNLIYFADLKKHLPNWPWAFKRKYYMTRVFC